MPTQTPSGGTDNPYFEREVTRRFDEMTDRLEAISHRLETTYVRFDLFEASKQLESAEREQLSQRVAKLESRNEWLIRTVGGMLIAAALGVVLALGRVKTGG